MIFNHSRSELNMLSFSQVLLRGQDNIKNVSADAPARVSGCADYA